MSFAFLGPTQAWLLLGFTVLTVVVLYWLRPQPTRVTVPSTLLWRLVIARQHKRHERLRWLVSLLLSLTIAAAVALAVAGLKPSAAGTRRIVVVLDNSPSLAALTADGRQRWHHSVDHARRLIREVGAGGSVMLGDTAGQLATLAFEPPGQALDRLRNLRVSDHGAGTMPLSEKTDAPVYFITDGVTFDAGSDDVSTISVFEPAANVGVTRFALGGEAASDLALVELSNAGAATTAELEIADAAGGRIVRRVDLAAGARWSDLVDLSPLTGGVIEARTRSPNDAFDLDDVAFLHRPPTGPVRILLVTDGNLYLETALDLEPLVASVVTSPEAFDPVGLAEVDLVIFDHFAPALPPAIPALLVHPTTVSWLPLTGGIVTSPRLSAGVSPHPLLDGIDIEDLWIDSAVGLPSPTSDLALEVVLDSDQGPMMALAGNAGTERLIVAFGVHPAESRLVLTPGFPIFLSRVIRRLTHRMPALSYSVGEIELPWPDAEVVDVNGLAATTVSLSATTLFHAPRPGVYSVAAEGRDHLLTVAQPGGVSDINRSSLGPSSASTPAAHVDAPSQRSSATAPIPLRFADRSMDPVLLLLAAALVLSLLEWWTYLFRMTV